MTRDEALKQAWWEILSAANLKWAEAKDDNEFWYGDNYPLVEKAVSDILLHPTEYTAWIE